MASPLQLNQEVFMTKLSIVNLYGGYGKCSKISNTNCLPKGSRQAGQTQIRLLLKKQSDHDLPCLLFWLAFCEFQAVKTNFLFENRKRKVFKILEYYKKWIVNKFRIQ